MHISLAELVLNFPSDFVQVIPDFGFNGYPKVDNVLVYKRGDESRYIWLCHDSGAPRYLECVKHICLFHRDPEEGPAVIEWDKFNNITTTAYWVDGKELFNQGPQLRFF